MRLTNGKCFGFARSCLRLLASGLLAVLWVLSAQAGVRAQGIVLCAAAPASLSGVYVTVNLDQPQVNVRGGPNSYLYGKTGILFTGESAPALGRSPGGDWIQIACPGAPGDVGWVYAANVTLSAPVDLAVIEIPTTSTPAVTATIDPTLAAAYPSLAPTLARPPAFTPAPPLTVPAFTDAALPPMGVDVRGSFILAVGAAGLIILLLSFLLRR